MIRKYVKAILESDVLKTNAGIVIVRKFDNEWKVLCLQKRDGTYDITKGMIEPGESPIEAALREAYEESGIDDLSFTWGSDPISYGKGVCFVAQTSQDPIILPNPVTGIVEHKSYKWKSFKDTTESILNYLIPAIHYAQNLVEEL